MLHLPLAELLLLAATSRYAAQHLFQKGGVSGLGFRARTKTQIWMDDHSEKMWFNMKTIYNLPSSFERIHV